MLEGLSNARRISVVYARHTPDANVGQVLQLKRDSSSPREQSNNPLRLGKYKSQFFCQLLSCYAQQCGRTL